MPRVFIVGRYTGLPFYKPNEFSLAAPRLPTNIEALGTITAETKGGAIAHALTRWPGKLTSTSIIIQELDAGGGAPIGCALHRSTYDPLCAVCYREWHDRMDCTAEAADNERLLRGADCVVYDVESKRMIPNDRGERRLDGVAYAQHREDWLGIGIGCICAMDTRDMIPRVFLDDNLAAFQTLIAGRCVAGFANETFDDPLVRAHGVTITRSYDLLCALRIACGEPARYTRGITRAGRRVNDVARMNLDGLQKSADGAQAPVMFQRGRIGELVDYCLRDVMIETRLMLMLPDLDDPVTGRRVALPIPR